MSTAAERQRSTLRVAAEHLDPCEVTACKFARSGEGGVRVCCFGFRDEGCVHFNSSVAHTHTRIASLTRILIQEMFDRSIQGGAKTCLEREPVGFPHIDDVFEPSPTNIKTTKKVYGFIFQGHEYTYQDNSRDHGSCPHCGYEGKQEHIGYYGSGRGRIACFECVSCFEKFYYHVGEGCRWSDE